MNKRQAEVFHFNNVHTILLRLHALVRGKGADAHLGEGSDFASFHNTCKRRSMGVGIVVKVFIQVGMGIEMKDVQVVVFIAICINHRVTDAVVAAEAEQVLIFFKMSSSGFFYQPECSGGTGIGENNIACIMVRAWGKDRFNIIKANLLWRISGEGER